MGRPAEFANSVLVADHGCHRALLWRANVEGADNTVHASSGQDGWAIFVPIMGEDFVWTGSRGGWKHPRELGDLGHPSAMDRDLETEMVRGGGRGAQIEDAEERVRRDAGHNVRRVRREGRGIGARVGGKSR